MCEYRQHSRTCYFCSEKMDFSDLFIQIKNFSTLIYIIAHAIHSLSHSHTLCRSHLLALMCSLNLSSLRSILVDSSRRSTHTYARIGYKFVSYICSSCRCVCCSFILFVQHRTRYSLWRFPSLASYSSSFGRAEILKKKKRIHKNVFAFYI